MSNINRVVWGIIFFLGAAIFFWMDWQDDHGAAMGWFMLTGLWSAVCGIGYTVVHWLLER
ncbi:MAG: hypothetical protein OEY09_00700 [Gammaproteobacteria bacterium]|nr:hypothetical protein [Gammaproteobacteria bacterium]